MTPSHEMGEDAGNPRGQKDSRGIRRRNGTASKARSAVTTSRMPAPSVTAAWGQSRGGRRGNSPASSRARMTSSTLPAPFNRPPTTAPAPGQPGEFRPQAGASGPGRAGFQDAHPGPFSASRKPYELYYWAPETSRGGPGGAFRFCPQWAGVGVRVGAEAAVGLAVGTGVGEGLGDGACVGVGLGAGVGLMAGVGLGTDVGLVVGVGVGLGVAVGDAGGVRVGTAVGVEVGPAGVGVRVGVDVGAGGVGGTGVTVGPGAGDGVGLKAGGVAVGLGAGVLPGTFRPRLRPELPHARASTSPLYRRTT